MTKAELAVVDLIIEKCPVQRPFSISGLMSGGNLLIGKRDVWGEDLYREITDLLNSKDDSIRIFLLQEEYFKIETHNIPHDILTKKG